MGVGVRRAGQGDRELVVRLLDEAFQGDPVSSWVFPGAEYRRTTHGRLMAAFTDAALTGGYVDITEDGSACALWLSVPAQEEEVSAGKQGSAGGGESAGEPEQDEFTQIRDAVDPGNERVELIGRLTASIHPADRAHEYLWMIGVAPDRQGEGLGSALIGSVLDRCDREGHAVYLEASSARSKELYERLGFRFTGTALQLPDGPTMWPMWREPQPGSSL